MAVPWCESNGVFSYPFSHTNSVPSCLPDHPFHECLTLAVVSEWVCVQKTPNCEVSAGKYMQLENWILDLIFCGLRDVVLDTVNLFHTKNDNDARRWKHRPCHSIRNETSAELNWRVGLKSFCFWDPLGRTAHAAPRHAPWWPIWTCAERSALTGHCANTDTDMPLPHWKLGDSSWSFANTKTCACSSWI